MKEIIIKPETKWQLIDLSEIWRYRELFYIFTWRDIKIRYRQTLLGIIYIVIQPVVSMIIFSIFFGNLAKIPSGNLPYSLFVLIGLVFWSFFSGSLSRASDSMVANEDLLKKTYFPKIILPLSIIVTYLVDFSINIILVLLFAFALNIYPSLTIFIVLPVSIIILCLTVAGLSLFLSSANVKYRDVRNVLPFLIQIVLFLSPIIYPLSIVSERNRYIMALNPLTSVVEGMRTVFQNGNVFNPILFGISSISALLILYIGLWYFNKTERYFADIV